MPTLAEQIRQLSTGQPIEQPIDISQDPTELIQSITSQLPQNWSVRDLERNRTFLSISDRFLNAIGEDDDIFETLRDSDWNLTRALGRAYNSRRWDEQTQKDYQVLRTVWDQTQLEGAGEWLEAIKDVGVDIITDPIGWVGSPFVGRAVSTGIRGARAASPALRAKVVERFAQRTPRQPFQPSMFQGSQARDDIQRAINMINNSRRGTDNLIAAGVTGAFDGAVYDIATQLTERHTDMRDTFNAMRTLGFAGVGGTFGSGLAFIGNRGFRKANRRFNNQRSQEVTGTEQVARDEVENITKLDAIKDKWISGIMGRSTSAKSRFAKLSPIFAGLLKKIRPDALEGIAKGAKQLQEAVNIPYFLEKKELIGQQLNRVRTAINNIKTDSKGASFWDRMFKHRLTKEQELNLANLAELPVQDLLRLRSYIRKNGFVINDLIGKIPAEPKSAKAREIRDFFNRLQEDYGVDFNYRYTEDLVDASIEIQKTFRELGKMGFDQKLFSPGVFINERGRNYFPRYWLDRQTIKDKRQILENLIIDAGHADPIDSVAGSLEAILRKTGVTRLPEQKENQTLLGYLKELEKQGDVALKLEVPIRDPDNPANVVTYTLKELADFESVDQQVFKDSLGDFKSFTAKAKSQLSKDASEEEIQGAAKRLKAKAIVDNMINDKDSVIAYDSSKSFPTDQFLKTRVFRDIPNYKLREAGLIQTTDISKQINGYIQGMGTAIVDEKYLGRNMVEFTKRYINPIKEELRKAKVSEDEIQEMDSYLQSLYQDITGKRPSQGNTFWGKAYDYTLVGQALAHLPLAVISSITEPFLLIARADLADVPAAAKITSQLLKAQIKKTFDNVQVLAKKAGGKETKGYTTLREQLKKDPDFAEDFFDGLSQIEEASYRFVNFESDDLKAPLARSITDTFFKINFLNGWTQTVRAAAFGMAKSKIRRISRELAEGQTSGGRKLSQKEIARKREELFEIGIDANRSVNTYRNSLNADGTFNLQAWQNSKFYQEEVNIGSSMFANEIILNADASEASKPLWMNSPAGRLIFQFASYPMAFNNVILRRLARATIKDPTINAPKALAMATIMTSVAVLGNTARSLGQNLKEQDAEEIIARGFQRTGLLAQLDYIARYNDAKRYNPNLPARLMSTFAGPAVQDYNAVARGTVTMSDLFINNLPGIGVVPAEVRREWRAGARESIERYTEEPGPMVFAKGGEVTNVPNVSPEPDEMKIRGLPYTYQQVAGGIMKETEDRLGFQEGGMVADDDFMQVYQYLTKDEKYYESDDDTPLFMYKKNEVPNPTVKKEMYISLPENSYQALFYECREGQEVGLPVYDSQMKTDKPFRFKGYVKFSNPLELNIDNTSPEEISRELENIDLDKAYLGKKQSERMIKEIKFQLSLRDDMLSKDPRKSRAKEERMRESKCFIIRDRLLRMGFDAIKFNNGYSLLKQNQFFPTEEAKIGFKKGGLVDRMRKRKGYAEGGEAKSTSDLLSSLLSNVTRATPEQEREYWQNPLEDFRWGETTDDNIVYLNTAKHEAEGSDEGWERDMFLGESLHRLNQVSPEWYNRLYQAAENDEDVQRWKQHSYDVSTGKAPDENGNYVSEEKRERRPIEDWWRVSRFDQLVGGWILGGEGARSKTMRNWNRDRLPYGTSFRKELEDFEDALGYRRGYAEGGFVSSLLDYIVTARNLRDSRPLESYADAVAWQESRGRGPQTVQDNNGPARGKYQVEGSQGSRRNDTILQRAINFYDKYPDAPTSDEIQYALSQRGQDLDFSTLSEETQDALFYMDAERGRLPINDLYSGTLSNRDAWITYWNQDPNIADPEVRRRREEDWERATQERMRNN